MTSTNTFSLPIVMIGLGRMGGNMSRRLSQNNVTVHGFDPSADARSALKDEANIRLFDKLSEAIDSTAKQRIVWVMLPAGDITEQTLTELSTLLKPGDILIDGGNANYQDTQRRAQNWTESGIEFLDCGVSGGVWGLQKGYCLMLGGPDSAVKQITPVLDALSTNTPDGWLHCGAAGAGHYTKMIHNGIEYGTMQAMAEGFALLDGHDELDLDLPAIAKLWQNGSVVRSWLLDLTAAALNDQDDINEVAPVVADSGEGRWAVDEAVRQGVPAPVIAASLMSRFDSQGSADTTNRLLAIMRKAFGGHATLPDTK